MVTKKKKQNKEIDFDDFAKLVSVDPKRYIDDTIDLSVKFKVYILKYGDLGMKGLTEMINKDH